MTEDTDENPDEEVEELMQKNLVITKQNQIRETVLGDALLITVQWDTGSAVSIILLENNEQTLVKQENSTIVNRSRAEGVSFISSGWSTPGSTFVDGLFQVV